MAGRKRSSDVPPAAKITKYFCSELESTAGGSGSQTESEVSLPQLENGTSSSASSSATSSNTGTDSCESHSESINDLGYIIKSSMGVPEVCRAVSELTDGQRYKLLKEHYRPRADFRFPRTFSNGCYRSFQYKWLEKYPWLVYSKVVNGGFCKFCALFSRNRDSLGMLVNKPFTMWVKVHKIVEGHASNNYHFRAVHDALDFQRSIEHPETNIDVRMSSNLFQRIQENRHIVKCCAECILYCGRQCIALRGDNEKRNQPGNPGNFLAMLRLVANHDPVLKTHLETPRQRNSTYISPHTQNEIIEIIGKQMIQKSIVDEIIQARFYSIMVDEVTSHNQELMPLCVRFVDVQKNIREEFIQFSTLSRVTGEAIAARICSDLTSLGLDLKNIRGQGYDGASNMSSNRVGVQALIREHSPLAFYTHCSGHCLNLVICHSCTFPIVRNVIDKMKATCLFFLNSPKRNGLLCEIVTSNVVEVSRRKPLIDLCKTRWAERQSSFQHFYQAYKFIVIAYEAIALGLHRSDLSENYSAATWDPDSRTTANSLLHAVTTFEFIIGFLIIYHYLSHLAGISVKLQSSTLDILQAYQEVDEVKQFYKRIRENLQQGFTKIYEQAERMGAAVNVQPSKPRTCIHQRNRPNAQAETVEEWYRVNVAVPFIDHITVELDSQFSAIAQTSTRLLGLVPSVLCSQNELDVSEAVQLYHDDLPSPELFDEEFSRWRDIHTHKAVDQRPKTCASALKECDSNLYPNISVLLRIACTLPVSSCECERNASVIRRLRNFMRAGMTESRLTSLALMHIHYQYHVDLDTVVQLFAELHPRRLQLRSVIFEYD